MAIMVTVLSAYYYVVFILVSADWTKDFLNQITSYQQLLNELKILWKACHGRWEYTD